MKEKLVSIIMPAHNVEEFIEDSIKSVLKQTYTNWELLVVNNKSVDKTADIIKKYEKQDVRVKYLDASDKQGVSYARNVAIKFAKGDYIAFLDSDDLWLPTKLKEHIAFMQQEDLALSYTPYLAFGEINAVVNKLPQVYYKDMLKTNHMGCSTVIYSVEKLDKKYYFSDVKIAEDWVLWCKILKSTGFVSKAYGKPLTKYRVRKKSLSSSKMQVTYWRYKNSITELNLNFFSASYYLAVCMFLALRKKGWTFANNEVTTSGLTDIVEY